MKKLMTMIAAVAMAFGLYATDFTAHTIDFSSITEGNYNLSENTGTTGLYWSYDGQTNGAYEATEDLTVADSELTLNTSSKVLKRTFADLTDLAAPVPVDIDVEKGLYADMVLNLNNEILDTVPELDDSTKIAFFAMGGEDAAEVGLPVETNLYVYAAYGEGKALFKLMDDGEEFIAMNRRIAIKAYANVMASGTRTGFLIYAGDQTPTGDLNPVKVDEVYTLTDTTWTKVEFYEEKAGDYLGEIAVDATYSKWIALGQRSLFVSIDGSVAGNGALTSVEFKGRAKLASIALTDEDPGFASDGATMDIYAENASVTAVEGNGAMLINDDTAIFMPIANVVTATVAAASGYTEVTVKVGDLEISEIEDLAGKYEFTLDPTAELSVKGWNAAATVGDKKFPYIFGDDPNTCAIAYVNANGGTLKLAQNVTADDEGDAFEFTGEDVVLDLAGKTLTVLDGQALSNAGKLTIIDSATGGKIVGATENYNTMVISNGVFEGTVDNMMEQVEVSLEIAGGTFEGKVSNEDGCTIIATAGQFLQESNDESDLKSFLPDDDTYEVAGEAGDNYWVVREKQITKGTVIFICEKNGAEYSRVTNDTYDVGTTIAKADFPTFDLDSDVWTLTWNQDSVTVAETETEVTATATIEFTGEGTEAAPYQIASAVDFKKVQAAVADGETFAEKFLVLANDVDMSGIAWTGIGAYNGGSGDLSPDFRGTLNGAGYAIQNITFARGEYYGFFNQLENATISNITFNVAGFADGEATSYGAGVIANWVKASTFDHVTVTGELTGSHNVVGFVIKATAGTTFKDCVNNATVTCTGTKRVAGFVGFESALYGGLSINFIRCVNNGDLSVKYVDSNDYGVGGFIGGLSANNVAFTDCVNNGAITATDYTTGEIRKGAFIGCIRVEDTYAPAGGLTVTATGCSMKIADGLSPIGSVAQKGQKPATVTGFDYATAITGTMITYNPLAEGGTFTLMHADLEPAFTLEAIGDTITFKTNLFEAASFVGIVTSDPATIGLKEEADANGVTFTATAAGPAPIDPTKPTDPMSADKAADKAAEINANPEKYIKAPDEFALAGKDLETYQGYFKATVAPAGGDQFVVQLELNEDGTNAVVTAEQTADAEVLTTVLEATEATSMTVPTAAVIPGFYYSMKQGAALQSIGFVDDDDANKKGGVDTLTFQLQKPENSGFYQMLITPKPVDVPDPE